MIASSPSPASLLVSQIEQAFPGIWAQMDKAQPLGPVPGLYPVGIAKVRHLLPGENLPGAIPLRVLRAGSVQGRKEWDDAIRAGLSPDSKIVAYSEDALRLAAAWRATKLQFRFDSHFFDEMMQTPLTGVPPAAVFSKLPVACFFMSWNVSAIASMSETTQQALAALANPVGAFVYCDGKTLTIQPAFSRPSYQQRISISLGEQSIEDAVIKDADRLADLAIKLIDNRSDGLSQAELDQARATAAEKHRAYVKPARDFWTGLMSCVLYMCSEEPDVAGFIPCGPKISKMGKTVRILAPQFESIVSTGARFGSIFRQKMYLTDRGRVEASSLERQAVVPHVRRAHWHTYWTGVKGAQKAILKWIAPVFVNVRDEDVLQEAVHPVMGPT